MEVNQLKGEKKMIKMIKAYEQQARREALALIAKGYDPECFTHLIEYPKDYYLWGKEYMHLTTPLLPDSDLTGHLARHYTLGELAQTDEE